MMNDTITQNIIQRKGNQLKSLPEKYWPLQKEKKASGPTRPSLSYWQDAFIRFKKNKQALFSFGLVVFLVLFVVVGPWLWTIGPEAQDMNRISMGPSLGTKAMVVDEQDFFEPQIDANFISTEIEGDLPAPQNMRLLGTPTSLHVRLAWDSVPGATGYVLYRNEVKPNGVALGIPLGDISEGNQVSFEDNQSVEAKTYYYTLVTKNMDSSESSLNSVLRVDVMPGISTTDAGLLAGETIKLPASPLGTDSLGRDVLSRLMYGGRISLFIGVIASVFSIAIGIIIGGVSGFFGGRVDDIVMRFTDLVMGFPFLLFMILLSVVLNSGPGESGITALLLALVVLSWTGAARLVRGQILQIRESEYVQAARLMGARSIYTIYRHMLPNIFGLLLVALTFGVPSAIFTEAFLSFIGLGVAAPATSWGSMCNDGLQSIMTRPHEFFFPALFISIAVLAFNLMGDGLRDALDPKLRSHE